MVYVTEKFRKEYSTLDHELKSKVIDLVNEIKTTKDSELRLLLEGKYLGAGKSRWDGISKVLYHLYPQGKGSQHRLFYCFASDLNNDELMKNSNLLDNDVIFIDYTKLHDQEERAARNYNRTTIDYLYEFNPPIDELEINKENNIPSFWFRLTEDQTDILRIEQPASIKGSAGTGKTFISFELFKDWIKNDKDSKLLYLTYTDKLLDKAKENLLLDGVDINKDNINILKFQKILNDNDINVIDEIKARKIIKEILENMYKFHPEMNEDIIFTDYFIYAYIRGLIKGRVDEPNITKILKVSEVESLLRNMNLGLELTKTRNILIDYLDLNKKIDINVFRQELITKILVGNKNRKEVQDKLYNLFNENVINQLNEMFDEKEYYSFIKNDDILKELKKDNLEEKKIKLILEIYNRYNKKLQEENLIDDNDYALNLLNKNLDEKDMFDGIIIDEVQDLTEIQIMAITRLLKKNENSNNYNISFFGDPNQTINPTIYHYGRFNSYLWEKTKNINQRNLKRTHRCGENLLEYINHLVDLRKEYKLTTNTEDLEKEESARFKYDDGHFACLIEEESVINAVFENLKDALDYYLIVDNYETRKEVIDKIKLIDGNDYDDNIESQIITVQESKGLESSNIIMYNLVSDNIDIFSNLMEQNNKISAMTFNKFYVSVTRAKNTVIICETELYKNKQLKEMLFYVDGKKIPEDILEEDIPDYLEITTDPEKFYDQALKLLEKKDYEKAYKKSNIALRHLINQFELDEEIINLISSDIKNLKSYKEIIKLTRSIKNENIKVFKSLYKEFLFELSKLNDENTAFKNLINKRFDILKDSLRIRLIYEEREEFFEFVDIYEENDVLLKHEKFINLQSYDNAIEVLKYVSKENELKYKDVADYIFGNTTFDKIRDSFNNIKYEDSSIYENIIDHELKVVFKEKLIEKILEIGGDVSESV